LIFRRSALIGLLGLLPFRAAAHCCSCEEGLSKCKKACRAGGGNQGGHGQGGHACRRKCEKLFMPMVLALALLLPTTATAQDPPEDPDTYQDAGEDPMVSEDCDEPGEVCGQQASPWSKLKVLKDNGTIGYGPCEVRMVKTYLDPHNPPMQSSDGWISADPELRCNGGQDGSMEFWFDLYRVRLGPDEILHHREYQAPGNQFIKTMHLFRLYETIPGDQHDYYWSIKMWDPGAVWDYGRQNGPGLNHSPAWPIFS
jgi:hypothetical protein